MSPDSRQLSDQGTAPDGRPGCDYCAERLRVNVGLLAENRQMKERLASQSGWQKIAVGDARDWKARAQAAEATLIRVREALNGGDS